ncbi:MAG TPA: hypothetical protein VND64_15025 [Pirellulales bacterium]|nr:hypothetical protein [Pirellulales bacterium]
MNHCLSYRFDVSLASRGRVGRLSFVATHLSSFRPSPASGKEVAVTFC